MARRSLAFAIGAFLLAWVTPAIAQQVPVFVIASSTDDPSQAMPAMNRVAAAIGPDVAYGPALSREVAERYGRTRHGGDRFAAARASVRPTEAALNQAFAQADQAAISRAVVDLESLAGQFDTTPEGFEATPENVAAAQDLFIFAATAFDRIGDATRAAEYARRLARLDPALSLSPVNVPQRIRQLYQDAVATLPRGSIAIESSPPGCAVFRDAQMVGAAPIELQDLPAGRHRIQLRCGATYSLVHPVDVAARTRATVSIDAQLDGALSVEGPTVALLYPSLSGARSRIAHDLALLGRPLGAHRAYGLIAGEDRVVVVDVATATEVGDSPVTDGSRLRALRTQAVGGAPAIVTTSSVASSAPPADEQPVRTTLPDTRRPYVPVAAIVIGVTGCLGIAAGAFSDVERQSSINRAEQASDAHVRYVAEGDARTWQWVEIGTFALGGALVLTGVLIGVLAPRPSASRASVAVAPLATSGVWTGVSVVF